MYYVIAKTKEQYDQWLIDNHKIHNVEARLVKSMIMLTGFHSSIGVKLVLLPDWEKSDLFSNPYAKDAINMIITHEKDYVVREDVCKEHGYAFEDGMCPECRRMRDGTSNIILE